MIALSENKVLCICTECARPMVLDVQNGTVDSGIISEHVVRVCKSCTGFSDNEQQQKKRETSGSKRKKLHDSESQLFD